MYSRLAASSKWTVRIFFASAIGAQPYYDEKFEKTIHWSNLSLESFPHEFLNSKQLLPSNNSLDAPDLEERLAAFEPDVVIIYGYAQRLQRRALKWATHRKCPVLMISDAELRQHRSLFRTTIKRPVVKNIIKKVTGFLTVGDANEDYYTYYGASPHSFYRSPFPIDVSRYEQAWGQRRTLRDQQRAAWSIDNDQLVWLMVGKFSERKRQRDLVNALSMTQQPKNSLTLVLVGSGECEQKLKAQALTISGHRVIFTGFVPPTDLAAWYAVADIYVHCSEHDPHPLAISEAIYLGQPVIASSSIGSVGPTDDVQPGVNGFCYATGNVHQLAELLDRLSEDINLREYLGQNSRQIAQKTQFLANGQGLRAALMDLGLL